MATEEKMLTALKSASDKAIEARSKKEATDLCEYYKALRPLLVIALPLIEKIPVYGKKIGDILRFLMTMADKCCSTMLKARRA
ncbi:hypothetical protein YTPLAS72_05430 [Nitrospira sp.]|nr:hypothetical protein YTPLAS72_05430 [Nitrospira sp.]